MKKLDKIIRKGGIGTFFSLFLLMFIILLFYHIITVFGLNYFLTQTDLSLGPAGESPTYAKAHFDTARMISAGSESENAYFAVLCPDGRSSFLLKADEKTAEKINKKLESGKTIDLRGTSTALDEAEKNKYLPYFIQYGYEVNLIRNNVFSPLSFTAYWKLHPIINSLTAVILLLIIFFMIRSLMYGSYGNIKRNCRKFGYELEDIGNDFETAEKYGRLSIGKKYFIVTQKPVNAVAADDVVLAYIHHTVEKVSFNFIPVFKQNLFSIVLTDKKGREYEISYPSEVKASEALTAISRFGHITTSTTDEYRNSARASIRSFVELSEDKKKEQEKLKSENTQ